MVVKVVTSATKVKLKNDYQFLFKNQSFNQALIRAEVSVDTEFYINTLPNNDVFNFKQRMGGNDSSFTKNMLGVLCDKYGKYKVSVGINGNQNKKTYLFLTSLTAGNVLGSCSIEQITNGGIFILFLMQD